MREALGALTASRSHIWVRPLCGHTQYDRSAVTYKYDRFAVIETYYRLATGWTEPAPAITVTRASLNLAALSFH